MDSMQPAVLLMNGIASLANRQNCLFSPHDLRSLLPLSSNAAFKTLLTRLVAQGSLTRICRGLYVYEKAKPDSGLMLFHAAAKLRDSEFNYISLETALSAAGVISQQPMQWVSIMTSGRSSIVQCDRWGTIEFVHTCQTPSQVAPELHFDVACRLWRANVKQALRDMRATRRSMDLIDWSVANEFV
jgi:hypothetical protein